MIANIQYLSNIDYNFVLRKRCSSNTSDVYAKNTLSSIKHSLAKYYG